MRDLFEAQRAHRQEVATTTPGQRQAKLQRLQQVLLSRRSAIREALFQDLRRHPSEVDLTEVYPVLHEIKHAVAHLPRWMRPQPVPTPRALLGSRSWIVSEPKGVALILAPWNFPVNLCLGPLVSAVAAGNCVILKPSEHTPNSARVLREIVGEVFPAREVAVVEGAAETAQELLGLPFNHVFFTGSPAVGKQVMRAAAEHLASVTLELGGKSPVIVDETANLAAAAGRIAWGKFLNCGQMCIAPDYLFVHETRAEELLTRLTAQVKRFYGQDPRRSPSYARLVNERHLARVAAALDQARAAGAQVVLGGRVVAEERFLEPTIVRDAPLNCDLMTQEIFGPVLPVYTFRSLDEPLAVIEERDRPLALYLYSESPANQEYVLKRTRAGGTCVNHNGAHYFNNDLPFGGVGPSGTGKSHGHFGFQAFSNQRAVLHQRSRFSGLELMMPPYSRFKQWLVDLTLRWL